MSELERHLTEVASSGPSRFVLVLGDDLDSVRRSFEDLEKRAAGKAIVVPVTAGEGSYEDRLHAALLARLSERNDGRPGVALLVDALVQRAADFVMGPDLPQIKSYLASEALDERPAVAARVLVQRFVPALVSSLSGMEEGLLETIVRERTGSLDGRPTVAEVLAKRPRPEALAALGELAKRSGTAIVAGLSSSDEHAAAPALEVARCLPGGGAWLLLHGVLAERWASEAALLSDDERKRVGAATVKLAKPAAPAPVFATPAPPPPRPSPSPAERGKAGEGAQRIVSLSIRDAIATRVAPPKQPPPTPAPAPAPAPATPAPTPAGVAPTPALPHFVGEGEGRGRHPALLALYVVPVALLAVLGASARKRTGAAPAVSPPAPVSTRTLPPKAPPPAPAPTPAPPPRPAAPPLPPAQQGPPFDAARLADEIAKAKDLTARLTAIDRVLPNAPHAEVLPFLERLLDSDPGARTGDGRLIVIDRFGLVRDQPRALERLMTLATSGPTPSERLVALGAIAKSTAPVPPADRLRIEAISRSDAEPRVRQRALDVLKQVRVK